MPNKIEKIARWKTKNGKIHGSEIDAESHIVQTLTDQIGPIIDEVNKGLPLGDQIRTKVKMKLVEKLVGTSQRAENLKEILVEMV